MEEMNRAISIILSDIDILLLKSEDKRENVNVISDMRRNNPLDIIETKRCEVDSVSDTMNDLKLEVNEIDLKNESDDDDNNNNNHMLPTINDCDTNIKTNINNALMRNFLNSDLEHGNIEGNLMCNLDCETGINTSLRMFVRKFDEIAQNINRILCNLSDKQQN